VCEVEDNMADTYVMHAQQDSFESTENKDGV